MGRNKKRKNEETEGGRNDLNRASWSREALHSFCDLCIRHIVWTKGKNGALISPRLPWKVIVAEFQKKTNLAYDKHKLKHKWDWMRIKWNLWKALKGEDTGLCWDPVKGTINASEDWWNKKIQENMYFKSFRVEGIEPELEYKMKQLFGASVALGVDGNPIMDFNQYVPSEMENVCIPSPHQNLNVSNAPHDFDDEKSENSAFNVKLQEVSNDCSPILSPIPLRSTAAVGEQGSERVFENEKGASESNKISGSEIATVEVIEKLDSLVKVANKRIKDMELINCESRKHAISSYSVDDSIAKLVSLPGLTPGSHEFCFACTLIEDPQKRTILHGIPDDNSRLQWIKFLYEEYKNRQT